MLTEIKKLYETGILAPAGIYRLVTSLLNTGVNPMALLAYAAKAEPNSTAITNEDEHLTYAALYAQCMQVAVGLQRDYHLTARQKVAILCRNHASFVRALFAASSLGAHVYLLNVEMSTEQLSTLVREQGFHLMVHDGELEGMIGASGYMGKRVCAYGDDMPSIAAMSHATRPHGTWSVRRARAGNIIVLTGGTTGNHKTASRKPGVMRFVSPFCALLVKAGLAKYKSVYIATPMYHGYGLAALFISVLLRSRIYLQRKFDAEQACALIEREQIEVTTIVPLMLHRMLACSEAALRSLRCVITGGAPITAQLVQQVQHKLGPVLYNLYGTSEAGICIMATPEDLAYAADTIGKSIPGVQLRIAGDNAAATGDGLTGRIWIKNSWSVTAARNTWIDTGDVGYRNAEGYIFLRGRGDDMIVSGGENVYPAALEYVLLQHSSICEVAVIGVQDEEFGQRLKAFVVPQTGCSADEEELRKWLHGRVARYEMPVAIEVLGRLPYTPLGKPDKRKLRSYHDVMQ